MPVSVLPGAHPGDRRVELLRAVGARFRPVSTDDKETVRSEVLLAGFRTVAGLLHISWEDGCADV